MDINQLTFESIQRYYKVLEHTGYLQDNQVYKLLILSYITELFQDEFSWYITEDDLAMLTDIIDCFSKTTCIIPYGKSALHTEAMKNYLENMPTRVSDNAGDAVIRMAESDVLRLSTHEMPKEYAPVFTKVLNEIDYMFQSNTTISAIKYNKLKGHRLQYTVKIPKEGNEDNILYYYFLDDDLSEHGFGKLTSEDQGVIEDIDGTEYMVYSGLVENGEFRPTSDTFTELKKHAKTPEGEELYLRDIYITLAYENTVG